MQEYLLHPPKWAGCFGKGEVLFVALAMPGETFCVSLNTQGIQADKVLGTYRYAHPQFSPTMVSAQRQRQTICGVDGVHFCGAYWYNGFHEDGVRSALDVCERFGASL